MGGIVGLVGSLTLIVILFYCVMLVLAKVLKIKDKKNDNQLEMPTLVPLAIPTKDQPSCIHKLVAFVTKVRRWKLAENWKYNLNDQITIIIPKGFEFDGASIPRLFWAFLSPVGLLLIPGLIHDFGYKHDQIWKINEDGSIDEYRKGAGKKYWDNLFQEVGDSVNNVLVVNLIAKFAVAIGGKSTWNEHRELNIPPVKPLIIGHIEEQ